nr:Arm DNA-binding domain-containing protein [Burkholderia ubonensis]
MPLTDVQVRNAKASAAPYKLTDGNGTFLLVQPNGAKYWRLSYRFLGKQKTLALGVYPAVTLATARKKRDEAREQIAAGIDPGEAKKEARRAAEIAAANSLEAVAREWFDSQRLGWTDGYAEKVLNSLEVDVFSKITFGVRPYRTSLSLLATKDTTEMPPRTDPAHHVARKQRFRSYSAHAPKK